MENYNFIEKMLHYFAFSVPGVQKLFADIEDMLFRKELSSFKTSEEVFVTGLPRSGTTFLLNLLYDTNEFCTFSYRHMPFVLAPLLWQRVSSPFFKKAKSMERAHGDGVQISFDSPEAFEEAIWLQYLKNKYVRNDRLVPLTTQTTSKEFASKLTATVKKILFLTNNPQSLNRIEKRYVSKNNANCSRIEVIKKIFPDAIILIPFREPLAHVGSLMKQHKSFCELHKKDVFAKRYMRWLGHYDFGENFKPIDFEGWLGSLPDRPNYEDGNFWLRYWVAAYSSIINQIEGKAYLVNYDKILSHPQESLKAISSAIKLENSEGFINDTIKIRSPTSKATSPSLLDSNLLAEASRLHSELKIKAL